MGSVSRKGGVQRHIRHIEAEHNQPLHRIIEGYYQDGESQRSVSRILRLPRTAVRRYSITAGLEPPETPITLQTRSRIHRAHIRATMRRRHGRRITWQGKTRSLSEWAQITGIPRSTLRYRLDRNWPVSRALTERP